MPRPLVDDMAEAHLPSVDGELNEYVSKEAEAASNYFDFSRRVVFVNGMGNTPEDHARSALALSFVQMCRVIAVYNRGGGFIPDLWQCLNDKNQFNGLSWSAENKLAIGAMASKVMSGQPLPEGAINAMVAQRALSRNPPQVTLFNLLRQPANRNREIFAHSQGNLILSNALQAIAAVDGPSAVVGRVVHCFGSPALTWPTGIVLKENAYSVDPFAMLSGVDLTFSISKVATANGSWVPYAHSFLDYLRDDPAFVINRFRTGGLGITLSMDEKALAKYLAEMSTNLDRVQNVFRFLKEYRGSDADDVAVRYVYEARTNPAIVGALQSHKSLVALLIEILEGGVTFSDERVAIEFLAGL